MKSVCVGGYLRLHLLMHMDSISLGTDSVRGGKDVSESLGVPSRTRSQHGLCPCVPAILQSNKDCGCPFAHLLAAVLIPAARSHAVRCHTYVFL